MKLPARFNAWKSLTPWSLILILLVAVVIFSPAVSEYISVKRDFLRLWHDQAALLSETIVRTADKIAVFDQEARRAERERLRSMALYVRHLDSLNAKDRKGVVNYVRSQGRIMVLYLKENGEPVRFKGRGNINRHHFLRQAIRELLDYGTTVYPEQTLFLSPPEKPGPLIAVVRRARKPGYIALITRPFLENTPAVRERLLRWLDHLTNQPDILFIALWRGDRVIARSGAVGQRELVPPPPGPPNSAMIRIDRHRVYTFQRREPNGLGVQIGFSVAALENLQNHLIRRLIINSFILLLFGGVLAVYILKRQNYALLSRRYRQLQTSTSAILENMEEGIIVLDAAKKITIFNQAAAGLLGMEGKVNPGEEFVQVEWPLPGELQLKILSGEKIQDFAMQTGSGRYLLLNSQRIRFRSEDSAGKEEETLYLILLRDYTSQKELNDYRMRRSKLQAMGELASRVAHEIRNPLNSIGVLAQRLEKEFTVRSDEREYRQMTTAIRQESTRINHIIETFLEYARQPQLKLKPVDLKKLIEEAAPVFNATGKNTIVYSLSDGCRVNADAEQIRQALLNLVRNAREASGEQGEIRLELTCAQGAARIAVTDNGPGIREEIKDKVFDLYFTTKETGYGLGLSVVEKIVSAHGGKVWCENVTDGKGNVTGAKFVVELPEA